MGAKRSKKPARNKTSAAKKALAKKAPAKKTPAKKTPVKKSGAKKARAKKSRVTATPHPKLSLLLKKLRPGRHAAGTLIITEPGAHHAEMSEWLMKNTDGRVALGRTAFGDIVVFRDLREQATEHGLRNAQTACDVAVIDLNLKKMIVLAWSVEEFLAQLESRKFQDTSLRRKLYDRVNSRLGDLADDEVYAFVPALGLGGSEDETQVERQKWDAYQSILFQL